MKTSKTTLSLQDLLDIAVKNGWRNPILFFDSEAEIIKVGVHSISLGGASSKVKIESLPDCFKVNLTEPIGLYHLRDVLALEWVDIESIQLMCEGRIVTVGKLPVGAV